MEMYDSDTQKMKMIILFNFFSNKEKKRYYFLNIMFTLSKALLKHPEENG